MSSLEIRERLERADSYRGDQARPIVEVVRPAKDSLQVPLRRTWAWDFGVLASGLVASAGVAALLQGPGLPAGTNLPAVVACAAWVALGLLRIGLSLRARQQTIRRAQAARNQNLGDVRRMRVQDEVLHAEPRDDERGLWSGSVPLADIRAVRVVEQAGLRRVRIELAGGHEVTALEGIEEPEDAERVARYLRREGGASEG